MVEIGNSDCQVGVPGFTNRIFTKVVFHIELSILNDRPETVGSELVSERML